MFMNGMKNRYKLNFPLLLLIISVALLGCGSDDSDDNPFEMTDVSVQLSWVHNVEFVGFYEASDEGYYAENGISLTLNEGGFDEDGAFIDPIAPVVNGDAMFGITGAEVLLKARADGIPIVAIATIYQRSPVVLISLSESGINQPQDMVGKRVSTQPLNTTVGIAYEALIRSQDIDPSTIDAVMRTDFTTNPLFSGDADVLAGFITTEGIQVRQRDPDANFILTSEYGIDLYSNVIFTTEDTIANNPELVEAFLEATFRGIDYAIANPDDAATRFVETYGEFYTDEAKATQPDSMRLSLPLLKPGRSEPGMMTPDAWYYSHQLLLDLEILEAPLDIEAAFDMSFLNHIYSD